MQNLIGLLHIDFHSKVDMGGSPIKKDISQLKNILYLKKIHLQCTKDDTYSSSYLSVFVNNNMHGDNNIANKSLRNIRRLPSASPHSDLRGQKLYDPMLRNCF